MSKKKKTGHPVKSLLMSEDEKMIVDAGFTVHLPILAELKCAWWEDFREVLYAIGKDVANPEALGLFGIRSLLKNTSDHPPA